MRYFDYSFLTGSIPADITNLTSDIYGFRSLSEYQKERYEEEFQKLTTIAKFQSVKSSNAIEGIITTDERIKAIVNKNCAPLDHTEKEIAGYRDALSLVHTDYTTLDFCLSDMLRLHSLVLGIADYRNAGKLKEHNNYIVEVDDKTGLQTGCVFFPVSANETPNAVDQMTIAYWQARDNSNINKLLLIPCVILDFLCIHPFVDGNGRVSRLLSLLLLYRNNFDVGKYMSFEEQVMNRRSQYYDALRQASTGWHENKNDYFAFVRDFLTTLFLCYREMDKRFGVVHKGKEGQ